MTTATAEPTATMTREQGDQIVLLARVGRERLSLSAAQVRDTVAAYVARGEEMPTPRPGDGTDPAGPLHVITEEWLWGNVPGWVAGADRVQLVRYRAKAMDWIRGYFGPGFPEVDQHRW